MDKRDKDREILRELAKRYAEIASLPIHDEKRRLWRALNGLRPERPMVAIDQVCWEEMDVDGRLALRCEDSECQRYEAWLRRTLLQWELFPADMVVEPTVRVEKAISNTGFGVAVDEETKASASETVVLSHRYENQFRSIEDVCRKVGTPKVSHDEDETKRRMDFAEWLFGGVGLELRAEGADPYLSIWDPIATWMSVEGALFALADDPDMMHALAARVADGYMSMLDQLEEQGLLCHSQPLIHCTGAYVEELPAPGFDPNKPRTKDLWMFGLAQMFATVSPAMFDEYEIRYMTPIFRRFGLVYYGCCDPMDGKMEQARKIPRLRKVSMSPWANPERGAAGIGRDFVYSCKPNPALLAMDEFDGDLARGELMRVKEACERNGCPLEIIMKDISTVRGKPDRLKLWSEIAMSVACQ